MASDVLLVFPPSWTLTTGSPHLAVPLLQGYLRAHGVQASSLDLNISCSDDFGYRISRESAVAAVRVGSMEKMNDVYFGVEDHLNDVAKRFGGTWNLQLGFTFDDRPQRGLRTLIEALDRDSPFTSSLRRAAEDISMSPPAVVGISVASEYQLVHAFQLAAMIKNTGCPSTVVLGGNVVTRLITELACPAIFRFCDTLVAFGGETALLELAVRGGKRSLLPEIAGLTWCDGDNVHTNHRSNAVVSEVAHPSLDDFKHDYWGVTYQTVVAERGCYYGRCSFCAIPYGWGADGYAGKRTASDTAADLRRIASSAGVYRFKFVDEAMRPAFVRALATEVASDGFQWEAYARLEPAFEDGQLLNLASSAGLRKLYLGLELAPSSTRGMLEKNDHGQIDRILDSCAAAGVKVHLFCMAGFPGTTADDAYRTVEFLLRNVDRVDTADFVGWGYARHTTVRGVSRVQQHGAELALEYDWVPAEPTVMPRERVEAIAADCESALWDAVPRLLHPIYRLVSPWSG